LVISIEVWCPPLYIIKLSNDKITTKQKQSRTLTKIKIRSVMKKYTMCQLIILWTLK
jgi:hypothetical protein